MGIFRRGPEVGAENSILKSASFAEYMQTGRPMISESLKSAERPTRLDNAATFVELSDEML